jgi:hypothetical protein
MSKNEVTIAVPSGISIGELQAKIDVAWRQLSSQIPSILTENSVETATSQKTVDASLSHELIVVQPVGGGTDGGLVLLLISLAPVIKAVTPLISPLVTGFSNVAEKIALDIWDRIKLKLWNDDHVRIAEIKDGRQH